MHSIKSKKETEKPPPANRRQTKLVAEAINAREIFFQVRFSQWAILRSWLYLHHVSLPTGSQLQAHFIEVGMRWGNQSEGELA